MNKVSLIIPIYNVSNYIERCARSLFEQSLNNIEYIFIDDKSSDNSLEVLNYIIKEYPARLSQVKIIQNEINLGSASVRNIGLENVTGDYVGWVDADDWIEPNMFSLLLKTAQNNLSDVVICDYTEEWGFKSVYRNQNISKLPILDQMFNSKESISWSLWNKLFNRRCIDSFKFVPGADMGEDMMMVVSVLLKTDKISYINKSLYHYNRSNINSLVNSWSIDKIQQVIVNTHQIDLYARDMCKSDYYIIPLLKLISKYHLLHHNISDYKKWREVFPEANKYIIKSKYFSFKSKILQIIVLLKFDLLYNYLNSFRKN